MFLYYVFEGMFRLDILIQITHDMILGKHNFIEEIMFPVFVFCTNTKSASNSKYTCMQNNVLLDFTFNPKHNIISY